MPYTWIITKSQPHADSVVIQLRRQGFDALAVCCIEHHWHDWPELAQIGASGPALLFVTSRAAAARVEVPAGTLVAAIAPTTSATLEARGIRVALSAHGGVRELAQAVVDSAAIPDGAQVFYPTSDAALRQPEHLAAVATLGRRLRVHTQAVYSTVAPDNLAQELAALAQPGRSAFAARLQLLEPFGHRQLRGRGRLRAAARPGGADRWIDDALLAGKRAARVAARVPSRCRNAARMVAALPRARHRGRQR